MENITVTFSVPGRITAKALAKAGVPKKTCLALRVAFPRGLNIRRVERQGPGFILEKMNWAGQECFDTLSVFLYETYGYRFPPWRCR